MKNKKTIYLDAYSIKEINKISIQLFKQKKADSFELIKFSETLKVTKECERKKGDVYDKAVVLLKGIAKCHAFASGNRRTAILSTLIFCEINKRLCPKKYK